MKQIDLLPLSAEKKKRLNTFAALYKKNAHVFVEIVSFDDERLIVRAEQKNLVNGKKLTKKELSERIREMFRGEIPDEWKLTVSAVDFDRKDIDSVNVGWINGKMARFGLKNKTVSSHTGIDKCTLSSIINGDKELTKWHKVAFYYFFKYYEVAGF
jgi:hypothetical protein